MIHRRQHSVEIELSRTTERIWRAILFKLAKKPAILWICVAVSALVGIAWAGAKLVAGLGSGIAIVLLRDIGKAVGAPGVAGAAGAGISAGSAFPGWGDWDPFGTGPKTGPGFVWTTASGKADVHQNSSPDSAAVAHIPNGARVVYTGVDTDPNGNITSYYVHVIGAPPGWVSAGDVSTTAPVPVQPNIPLKLVDSGLGNAHATASMTLSAHG